jgi:hypothetical protein
MAIFPKIQSPCPYKGDLSAIMDGDVCRLCERQVLDLTHMTNGERVAFMKGCTGEVCVSYRMPVLAAVIAVAAIGVPMAAAACEATTEIIITTGGIKDPAHVQWVKDTGDASTPDLPVVYEKDAKPAPETPSGPSVSSQAGS